MFGGGLRKTLKSGTPVTLGPFQGAQGKPQSQSANLGPLRSFRPQPRVISAESRQKSSQKHLQARSSFHAVSLTEVHGRHTAFLSKLLCPLGQKGMERVQPPNSTLRRQAEKTTQLRTSAIPFTSEQRLRGGANS